MNCKFAILKQGMVDWPGNDRDMTLGSRVKLKVSKSYRDVVIGF